jgi:predicted AAA+ superfamily ATPase
MNHTPPLILDEIQYVSELFPYLKMKIGEMRIKARRGSQSETCLFLS